MRYNTQRTKLVIPEYGRNIQTLVEYAVSIEDDAVRQDVSEGIIGLMGQMNPGLRNIEDFRHKLWDHLFIISDFKLKVEAPYELPDREVIEKKPEVMAYPQSRIRFKHYGKNVEALIEKCNTMDDEPEKQHEFSILIASFMKMVYRNWNMDNVADVQIKEDLKILSEGKIDLPEELQLVALSRPSPPPTNRSNNNKRSNNNRGGGKNYRKNNNNNHRNRR